MILRLRRSFVDFSRTPNEFEVVIMDSVKLFVPVLATLLGVLLGAFLGFWNSTRLERRKEDRIRRSIAVVLQAELIRLHMKIKDHNALLDAYADRFSRNIDINEALKYIPIPMDREFVVYKNCIKELGLLATETAYSLVYCYANIATFVEAQDQFLVKLPSIAGSNLLGMEAKNLSASESALLQHIERIVPLLAAQSEQLPFKPRP